MLCRQLFTYRKTAFSPRRKGAARARPSAAPTAAFVVISGVIELAAASALVNRRLRRTGRSRAFRAGRSTLQTFWPGARTSRRSPDPDGAAVGPEVGEVGLAALAGHLYRTNPQSTTNLGQGGSCYEHFTFF